MKRGTLAIVLATTLLSNLGLAVRAQASPSPSSAPDVKSIALMREVATSLNHSPTISGRFEQTKMIAGFKNPLVSSGEFAAARDEGIVWHTLAPFESVLTITESRIASRHAASASQTLLGGDGEPMLRMVNELLFAIMTADLSLLSQRFEVSGQLLEQGHWQLDLTPREASLRQWITRVQLWGDAYVHKVVLHEAQGDRTTIVLAEHNSGSRVPDALRAQ